MARRRRRGGPGPNTGAPKKGLPDVQEVEPAPKELTDKEKREKAAKDEKDGALSLRLDLNLDVAVELKASTSPKA